MEDLRIHIGKVNEICRLIENEEEYNGALNEYLPKLNLIINDLLLYAQDEESSFTINEQFVIQVLQDVLYGMEYQDSVILLDALRYGLLEIYSYGIDELQSEEVK